MDWIERLLTHRHEWQTRGINKYGAPTYRICLRCRESQRLVSMTGEFEKCDPVPFLDAQFDKDDKYIYSK